MVVRISDKTQNYSKVTKLLVKPLEKGYDPTVMVVLTSKEKVKYLKNNEIVSNNDEVAEIVA